MRSLYLEVVTPEKVMVSKEVDSVVAPGSLGEFGVLDGHMPFLSGIEPGELRYTSYDEAEHIFVSSGFAEVFENKVSILVDAAEELRNIDVKRAQEALERARKRIEENRGTEAFDLSRAEAALKRANARIAAAGKAK